MVAWLLILLSKIGVVPRMSFFATDELRGTVTSAGFEVIAGAELSRSPSSYFIVARRLRRATAAHEHGVTGTEEIGESDCLDKVWRP